MTLCVLKGYCRHNTNGRLGIKISATDVVLFETLSVADIISYLGKLLSLAHNGVGYCYGTYQFSCRGEYLHVPHVTGTP